MQPFDLGGRVRRRAETRAWTTPVGEGGIGLHEWHFDPQGDDQAVADEWQSTPGGYIMGPQHVRPGRGEWDLDWTGWWGDEPPYHAPVFRTHSITPANR